MSEQTVICACGRRVEVRVHCHEDEATAKLREAHKEEMCRAKLDALKQIRESYEDMKRAWAGDGM